LSDARAPERGGLDTWAVVLSSGVVVLPLIFSAALQAGLDAANPAQIDITADLAYLRERLGFGFGFLGVLLIAITTLCILIARRDHSVERLRLPLIVVSVNAVLGVALLLLTALGDTLEAGYLPS
jgi:hypothetical protein